MESHVEEILLWSLLFIRVVIRRELCSRLPPPEILKMDLRGKTNYPKSVIIVIHIQQVQLYTCLYFKNFRLTEYHVRLAVVKNELLIKAAPALVSDKVATAVQCKACTGFRLILFSENIWDGYERGNWLWLNHLQEVNPILHLAFAIHRNRTTTKQERELSELLQVDIEEGEPTPPVVSPVSRHFCNLSCF